MKTHVIPFKEPSSLFTLIFDPRHSFDSEWCLDMHGFLDREDFKNRLRIINDQIAHLPLLSVLVEKVLMWISGIISFFVAAFLSGDGAAGLLKGGGIGIVLFIAMLVL